MCAALALSFTGSAALAEDAPNTLTDAEKQAGFKLLFDGKSTDGWRNYGKKEIGKGWQVADGALSKPEKGAGDIITNDEYGAFELLIDYKIGKGGNSGLMYHVKETDKAPYFTGPEIQVQDNKDGHDPQKAGWLYQLYPAPSGVDATKPAGEWNTLRVLITPDKCEQYVNGVKYCEYVKGSKDWDEKVGKSKFAKWEGKDVKTGEMVGFGKPTTGYLCLQDHGDPVSFRNIKIRPITTGK
ncbi:MAG: DUF1080 domain-containing protein [Pirellulales bacterium]